MNEYNENHRETKCAFPACEKVYCLDCNTEGCPYCKCKDHLRLYLGGHTIKTYLGTN